MLHLLVAVVVAAGAAQYRLDNPAQVLVMRDGALLVAERGTHNRLLRVNPTTGSTRVYATGIGVPWGLGYARDGSILVSATGGIYRLRPRAKINSVDASPFVVLPDGRIAYANVASVGVIEAGKAHPWKVDVSAPHGLSLLPDGALALGDTGNNRILRIDPATGTSTLLTDKVSTALGVAAEPTGSVLTVEYSSGRLLRVQPSGSVSVVATGLRKPYALARTRTGVVYVTESGELSRPTGTIRRITPEGRVSLVPLRPPASIRRAAAAAPRPFLGQPFDVLGLPNGRLVVTDRINNVVYSIDPLRRSARVLTRIVEPRELERLPDGRILVTSRARVLVIDPRTGRTRTYVTARNYLLGIALGPDGWLYGSENVIGSEQTTVVRLRGTEREVLAPDLHGVHGILVTPGALVLSESYGGRVLRLDLATRAIEVLATGLRNPSFTLPAATGGYFVSEFTGNRISHLWPDGHVTTVATVTQPGPIAFDSLHRIVGVTLAGNVFRIFRGRARTIYP